MSRTDYRNKLSGIAGMFSLNFLRKLSGQNLIHPFYHAVSDNSPAHLRHLYPIKSVSQFKADIDFYLRNFSPISPDKLLREETFQSKKPAFLLSFDDGLREIKEHVIPILLEKGITAIFFFNNGFIDNKDLFYRYKASLLIDQLLKTSLKVSALKEIAEKLEVVGPDKEKIIQSILSIRFSQRFLLDQLAPLLEIDFADYLKKQKPYLTSEEISDIKNLGFYIGSHSFIHPDFVSLNDEDQIREVAGSADDICSRFDLDYKYFAFPFTDFDISNKVIKSLHSEENGTVDLSFGTAGLKKSEGYSHFQRIPVEKSQTSASNYIKTEYFYFLLKELIGRNKLSRK